MNTTTTTTTTTISSTTTATATTQHLNHSVCVFITGSTRSICGVTQSYRSAETNTTTVINSNYCLAPVFQLKYILHSLSVDAKHIAKTCPSDISSSTGLSGNKCVFTGNDHVQLFTYLHHHCKIAR